MLFTRCADLFLDQRGELGFATQQPLQGFTLFFQLILLAANLHLFQLGKMAQTQFKDRFSLTLGQAKGAHQGRLGLILFADDADHLINIQVSGQ